VFIWDGADTESTARSARLGGLTVCVPAGEEKVSSETSDIGVQLAVKIPSPAARSGGNPSSFNVTLSPMDGVAVTGPWADSQLMLMADKVLAAPTEKEYL
jgi:hypothetical protein